MAGLKHPHKYKRHHYKTGTAIYFCTLPGCSHRVDPILTLGKESICNRCSKKFLMDEYAIRLAKPHCRECYKPKEKSELDDALDFSFDITKLTNNGNANLSLKERLAAASNSIEGGETSTEIANESDENLL